jgi:putative hemolysin
MQQVRTMQTVAQEPAVSTSALPHLTASTPYRVFLAASENDTRAAYRLRFRVFNLELQEGLDSAFATREDRDEFDSVCDHILVQHWQTGAIVGTYRLQSGLTAGRNLGYYSAREFDFTPYEPLRDRVIELGRACIHPDHRKYEVLMLLWKAIFRYASEWGARYLIGCSSLSSQDEQLGSAMYRKLEANLAPEHLRTLPTPEYASALPSPTVQANPPKLLRAYLGLGAHICGPPAVDREFKTIDFLTLMDLNNLTPAIRNRLLQV